ncbi:hypothetical protein BD289DRAFT_119721 [Coniella lustricola]|uniref:Clr5 domain-containing protein n=1 Tax=Coniella lustricola TaxID=2025994 RepID=A0A2T3AG30_9PEZI|nr:hypothetical protein BD289DRAFT_119721 [Coniella lustricola]
MGRRKISLDDYKDLVIALYQDGKSWRTIRAILHDEYGCDTSRHTIRKRCMAWDVEIRAQTKINDSLQDRIKELWADPEARPKDDHEMYQKLKADGFQVTLSAVCKLRKGLKLYRRWDEKWGRVRPDSELRGRKRHQQKYSYADFLAAQTSPATRASETCDGQDDQDESGDQDSQRQSDDEEDVAAEGLQAIAAATQGDRDGQSEQDNHARDVNEPRTTSATFQLDISTPYSDESEDGDEEIAETELDADYSDGGHPDNDNLEMAEDEADEGNDDGNSTPDGDSAEVKTPSERPSQQTHQFQTTPTEWYTNTHPGPTLADFPSPKLPKRHALPKKTKQPVMGLEGAQSPSTVLYSERERGKDA